MTEITYEDVSVPPPQPGAADWNSDGVVVLRNFIPNPLMLNYEVEWEAAHGSTWPPHHPGGWPNPTPYYQHVALRRLMTYRPLTQKIQELLSGEPPGLHLCLTGWVSTRRDWHQDTYLNPKFVGDSYAAVWIALEDIHPDSGPFQYVPGSHRWPVVVQDKIFRYVDSTDPRWPAETERFLTPIFEREIERQRVSSDAFIRNETPVVTYLPERGDVLIWHGRLVHRGSRPKDPTHPRRAVIGHYSGIFHRPDMPKPLYEPSTGGMYFPIDTLLSNTSGQVSPEAEAML